MTLLLSALVSLLLVGVFVQLAKRFGLGKSVRRDGPSSHLAKEGTPTMGGVAFLTAAVAVWLLADLKTTDGLSLVLLTLAAGLLGLYDDLLALRRKRQTAAGEDASPGLLARYRLIGQGLVALLFSIYAVQAGRALFGPDILDVLGFTFIIMGSINAVNFSDGLDGLAAGMVAIMLLPFLGVPFVSALVGSLLGFLWYNGKPARVFMGGVGSEALGAALAGTAILAGWGVVSSAVGPRACFRSAVRYDSSRLFSRHRRQTFFQNEPAPPPLRTQWLVGRASRHALLARHRGVRRPRLGPKGWNSMRALVYGLGRSGLAVSRLLARQGHGFVAFDNRLADADRTEVERLGGEVTQRPLDENVDICIAAPGVPYDHADLVGLRTGGLETVGEVEWVYRTVDAPIVGITGTAGKTSATRLLADVLQGAGVDAVAGGNIDPALAEVAAPGRTLVTELSSFQLERCPTLKPRVAVVLNLGVDHLDRHGSVAAYHEAKRAVTRNQTAADLLVYNADDPVLREWAAQSEARTSGFSLTDTAAACLKKDALCLHGEKLLETAELYLQGRHQWGNALAVALAAIELGVNRHKIADGLKNFQGVPGRYALAGTVGGVGFVEDSIATRTLAVRAALEATPEPVVWIVGGVDKGADLADLLPLVRQKVKARRGHRRSWAGVYRGGCRSDRRGRLPTGRGRGGPGVRLPARGSSFCAQTTGAQVLCCWLP